ncbi:MAG: hypothetical protein GY884_20875 [Proteobacteria bacterium]|nr:hypothetical protein [Pseudomonadota bacterium]
MLVLWMACAEPAGGPVVVETSDVRVDSEQDSVAGVDSASGEGHERSDTAGATFGGSVEVIPPLGTLDHDGGPSCLTRQLGIWRVELETGAATELVRNDSEGGSGLTRIGHQVVSASDSGRKDVWVYDFEAGTLQSNKVVNLAVVSSTDSGLLAVDRHDMLCRYGSYDALVLGSPSWCRELDSGNASRFAAHDGLLYGLWHSTDRVVVWDIESGEQRQEILLEGFDGRNYGVSVQEGQLRILTASWGEHSSGISTFEMDGAFVEHLDFPTGLSGDGLWCSD